MNKEFIFLGEGSNRRVYKHGDFVIKYPINDKGFGDNVHEAYIYKKSLTYKYYIQYAKCRLVCKHFCILIMEYVIQIPYKDQPEWAQAVDCGQVGINKRGKIVAYDYGWD